MKTHYDVLIVGASVAGASLALKLGQAGLNVGVFEKAAFPRRKPCGEGLSLLGFRCLDRLGLAHKILAAPHEPYRGFKIWTRNGPVLFNSAPEIVNGYGIQRYVLDDIVLSNAFKTPSVGGHTDCAVRQINRREEHFEVATAAGAFKTKYVVLACGLNSRLPRDLGILAKQPRKQRYGYSIILDGEGAVPPAQINIMLQTGYEIYVTPVGGSRINVNILGEKDVIRRLSREEARNKFLAEVKERLGYAGQVVGAPLGAGPVGQHTERSCYGNILLIGDCRESLDPIGGMGMSHALVSAELAGEALINIIKNGQNSESAFLDFERRRALRVRPLRGFTNLVHFSLSKMGNTALFPGISKLQLPARLGEALLAENSQNMLSTGALRALLHGVGRLSRSARISKSVAQIRCA